MANNQFNSLVDSLVEDDVMFVFNRLSREIASAADESKMTLLHYCSHSKNGGLLVLPLVGMGAKIDARCELGRTPLIEACSKSNLFTAIALVKAGADINLQTTIGESALSFSYARNSRKIIDLLLNNGANQEIKDLSGRFPSSYNKINALTNPS